MGKGRERESVTHAAFPLGTIPYPDTPQAISQHPCDATRSRDCSRIVLNPFGPVHFFFFFLFPSRKFSDEFCDCASLSRNRDVIQVFFFLNLIFFKGC